MPSTHQTIIAATLLLASSFSAAQQPAQQKPTPAAAPWWNLTTTLSSDAMEGRDTGTEAYERAARLVADHFKADGLQPAGDNGTYFQRIALHQLDLDTAHSSVIVTGPDPEGHFVAGLVFSSPLKLLYETTLTPREHLPATLDGELVFTGYGQPDPAIDLHGKIAVFFNNSPATLSAADRQSFAARRARQLLQAGAVALVSIDNPAAIEPQHWPIAYARAVTLKTATSDASNAPVTLRISADAADKLFDGVKNPYALPHYAFADILPRAEAGEPIPSFPLRADLQMKLAFTEKDISSPNIIAILPGSDPTLAPEYVAVSAHLDGYGFGTPVLGDSLYNGALDDAAYVATLLDLADQVHGHPPARSLLFCIFTGEEKGLLGSVYWTQHPTVPVSRIVADFNLDQLRPIFPLNILTMEGIADSTLGDAAKSVAAQFNIELRPDRETERNLFRRSDNYSFVRVGIPIASFIFGYNPNTPEERTYRDWYARRYHKPQDDLLTPIDWAAAVKFNDFYRALVLKVANDPTRPQWLVTSPYAPSKVSLNATPGCTIGSDGKIVKCH